VKIQATNRSEALPSGEVGRTKTRHSLSQAIAACFHIIGRILKAFRLIIHTTYYEYLLVKLLQYIKKALEYSISYFRLGDPFVCVTEIRRH
jgi:hypothetical protein